MNPKSDDDLLEIFAQARRRDHEDAPAWRPELLDRPMQRPSHAWRWVPAALGVASVVVLTVFLTHLPQPHEPSLSEALPPLFDSPPGELFASLDPPLLEIESPSDFLLTDHFNLSIP